MIGTTVLMEMEVCHLFACLYMYLPLMDLKSEPIFKILICYTFACFGFFLFIRLSILENVGHGTAMEACKMAKHNYQVS